jgi:hypothetical protein
MAAPRSAGIRERKAPDETSLFSILLQEAGSVPEPAGTGGTMTTAHPSSSGGAGSLRWGLKLRFLQYVANLPDGQCSVTDGGRLAPGPLFVFPADEGAAGGAAATVLRFRGDLRFKGHMGFLKVRIADPWLELDGDEGTLSALGLGGDAAPRRPLATFRVRAEEGSGSRGTEVRLTAEGSELFGDVYAVGELFDDFVFDLPDGRDRHRRVHSER